jgi:Tfp pilus assembly protein PilN
MAQSRPLDINILPEQYGPRQITTPVAVIVVVVAVLLFGLMPAYAVLTAERARTTDAQARLDRMRAALDQTQVDQGQLEQVDQQIEQTRDQITQLNTELETVGQRAPNRSEGFRAIANAAAIGVHVTTIAQQGDIFVITGKADSQALVLDYARVLQSGGWFASARILSIVNTDPLTLEVEFSLEAEQ